VTLPHIASKERFKVNLSIRNILFPTDFGVATQAAYECAVAIADKFDATLHMLHVVPVVMLNPHPATPWITPLSEAKLKIEIANRRLLDTSDLACQLRHRMTHTAVEGFEVEEILRYAKIFEADLIVIGTHGRRGLSHFFLGSVAEKVVRMAECPVLTVHPDTHQAGLKELEQLTGTPDE
jgi:nucleotide-binding universal stress UspA family protein